MLLNAPYGSNLSEAFKLASERGILPTWMSTAELRELEDALKAKAVFSARTTHADYLQTLRNEINKLIEGGYGSTPAEIRVALKGRLRELGYHPETGFAGDAELGIPPARAGSLRDLSSDRRLNLILDTQTRIISGKGQQERGLEPAALDQFPDYELVRGGAVKTPREWLKRWKIAAENVDWHGVSKTAFEEGRMIALKTSDVWGACGSHLLFDDALDVDHPPFAFGSQMVWQVRDRASAEQYGLITQESAVKAPARLLNAAKKMPPSVASVKGLDADFVRKLKTKLDDTEEREGRLTLEGIFGSATPPPPRKQRANAFLACVDAMELRLSLRHPRHAA